MIEVNKLRSMIEDEMRLPCQFYLYGYLHGAHNEVERGILKGVNRTDYLYQLYSQGREDGLGDREATK